MYDRDRIVEAIDLRALADELLGPRQGTERSATWPCPSPEHAQTGRTPPVNVFTTTRGEERWHCHGCGIGGSAVDLVMAASGVPVRDALDELAARAGIHETTRLQTPVRSRPPARPAAAPGPCVSDPHGLAAYIEECADRLWRSDGRPVLRWLTHARGLPEDVLRANRIGADPGRHRQPRPDGMPSSGWAAVLPAFEAGRPVFAQLRSLNPLPGRPRYLNASTKLAVNPRVATYEPAELAGRCVVVTEGVMDALAANAAGYRAEAVLGAALVGVGRDDRSNEVTERLTRARCTLVVAFDADAAGDHAAERLLELVRGRGANAYRVKVPPRANDLNGWLRASPDWQNSFRMAVRATLNSAPSRRAVARR